MAIAARRRTSELVDSSPIIADTSALRARIAADGYIFLRGLLDPAWVREVGAAGIAALERHGWKQVVRAVKMRDAFGDRGYKALLTDPGINCIPYTTALARPAGPRGGGRLRPD